MVCGLPALTRTQCEGCLTVILLLRLGVQVFEAGQMRGYWRMSYCDAGFRVFYTNQGNLFVLRRTGTA